MKQLIFIIIGLLFFLNQANGQNFNKQFNELISKGDTLEQKQLLEKWEKSDNNDPELYVAYYNYFANKSIKEVLTLGKNPKGEALKLENKDSSKLESSTYLYGDTYYDTKLLNKSFDYIDKGIKNYPDRLDMRFGKIYMLGKIEDYENFTKEIIKTIDYSNVIKNQWKWTENKPVNDAKQFMLSSIQSYQLQLYNTENDDLLDNMKRIAESVLQYYPEHIESLSNLSIVYLLKKDYDKALDALLKAEKIDPKDYIVLSNIAQAYKLKGDKKTAIKYYQLTEKYGDEQAKKYAHGQIEELKKK